MSAHVSATDAQTLSKTAAGRGELFLRHRLLATAYFPSTPITVPLDWTIDPFENRSWVFLYQQMTFVNDLLSYDEDHKSTEGRVLVMDILRDWWAQFSTPEHAPKMAWHDHGTALRAFNLIAVQQALPQDADQDLAFVRQVMTSHATHLANPAHYTQGTNHGLDQSMALYQLAACGAADTPETCEAHAALAVTRIRHEIDTAFAPDGGHRENSVSYHQFGLMQLNRVRSLMAAYAGGGLPTVTDLDTLIETATQNLINLLGPDGLMPQIGDTAIKALPNIFARTPREDWPACYRQYLYAISGGTRGRAPKRNVMVLPASGWISVRNHWRDTTAVHLLAHCAYASNYHRHDDDQSFVLKGYGEDWIIDGGLYQYAERDPYRQYLRSYRSHSLSAPTGEKPLRDCARYDGRSGIDLWQTTPKQTYVHTSSDMFPGHHSTRSFLFQNTPDTDDVTLTLTDHLAPRTEAALKRRIKMIEAHGYCYTSRFIAPVDKEVSIDRNTVKIRGKTLSLHLTCDGPISDIHIATGAKTPQIDGWRSTKYGTLEPAHSVEFRYAVPELTTHFRLAWQPH